MTMTSAQADVANDIALAEAPISESKKQIEADKRVYD